MCLSAAAYIKENSACEVPHVQYEEGEKKKAKFVLFCNNSHNSVSKSLAIKYSLSDSFGLNGFSLGEFC